jgi:hypothetical protein
MTEPAAVVVLLQRLAAGEIPQGVRRAAAGGALPLPPLDVLRVQAYLAQSDPDHEVQQTAAAALLARDPDEIARLLSGDGLSAEAATFFARADGTDSRILEVLAAHPRCPDEVVAYLAGSPSPRLIEALLLNQVRLIASPAVLEAIERNPALTAGQRDRLAEIRKHFLVPEEPLDPAVEAEMEEAIAEAIEEEMRLQAAGSATEDAVAASPGDLAAAGSEGLSTYQRVLRMTPPEKVKLAYRGSAEERALLIRDPNRVVARSVLRSPRLTDKEVESFVNMRSLGDEVLRAIASNREWLKSYTVVLGLVRNPKSPPGTALGLLQRLNNRDLNILSGDRNVTEVVRQSARRSFVARTAGHRGGK